MKQTSDFSSAVLHLSQQQLKKIKILKMFFSLFLKWKTSVFLFVCLFFVCLFCFVSPPMCCCCFSNENILKIFPLDLPVCICGEGDDPGAVLDVLTFFLSLSLLSPLYFS